MTPERSSTGEAAPDGGDTAGDRRGLRGWAAGIVNRAILAFGFVVLVVVVKVVVAIIAPH